MELETLTGQQTKLTEEAEALELPFLQDLSKLGADLKNLPHPTPAQERSREMYA